MWEVDAVSGNVLITRQFRFKYKQATQLKNIIIILANELQQEWYCYELQTPKNYSGAIAIDRKIDEIIYLER